MHPGEVGAVATTSFCNGLLGDFGLPKKDAQDQHKSPSIGYECPYRVMRQFGLLHDIPLWSLMAPYEDRYKALIPITRIRNLQNEWRYLRILSIEEIKWCMPDYYAWFTVGGHGVHPSGVGYDRVADIGLGDRGIGRDPEFPRMEEYPIEEDLEEDPEEDLIEENLIEEDPEKDPIEKNHIEEDPEEDPSIYDPNDGGIMEMGPGEELKNIPTQYPDGESEAQSEFRLEGHGEEGSWQMGDPEESSEDDFLKYLECYPEFHYDLSDDDGPTWT
ncbi:hypothetical protein HAX54_011405 [Datura stramonium]|uniref:Uncharacterized protein n=1 Tax=Datura stramonium TaxID=4076 RepID=A0ABS8TJI2_DATST|nr:hypothetical protein [Datura stramonium]